MDHAFSKYGIDQQDTICPSQPGLLHSSENLVPVTRFQERELQEAIQDMQQTLQRRRVKFLFISNDPYVFVTHAFSFFSSLPSFQYQKPVDMLQLCYQDKDHSAFLRALSHGVPAVVTDVPMQGRWDPQYFIDEYGKLPVTLVNCETGETKPAKVADFFNGFVNPRGRTGVWKLKARSKHHLQISLIQPLLAGLATSERLPHTVS